MQEILIFKKRKHDANHTIKNATLVIEGEIGNGKSTTGNSLMYAHCLDKEIEYDPKSSFKYGRQVMRVTSRVESQSLGDIKIIDTPGTNDFQSTLSDYDI
jgi:putative ribosome biogenesis GTPase RsgA